MVSDNHAEKLFNEAGGDFDTLILAIEDHIVQEDDGLESIDWPAVESTYEHMVQQPEWTNKDEKPEPDYWVRQHKCPGCDSGRITSDKIRFDGEDVVIVPMSCDECHLYWDTIFRFESYDNKRTN